MEQALPEKPTAYLETTVVSYLTARRSRDERVLRAQQLTRQWWDEERVRYRAFISARVIQEAQEGHAEAAARRLQALSQIEVLDPKPEIEPLAGLLRAELQIPQKSSFDALHVAFAIVYELDYLLTWNCAHLANPQCARRLANVCRQHNLWVPIISTPAALIPERKEQ